jgi:hypothetical protein
MQQKITIHELFHVWQYEYKWLGIGHDGPAWIVEGSAELVGMSGADAMGLAPLATLRGCAVKEVTDFNTRTPPGLPSLSQVEPINVWQTTIGPLYSYAWPAMEELTTNAGGIATLGTYGDAVATSGGPTGWQVAFQTAFKTSASTFYAQYPTYWASLTVPANYVCGGI